MWLSCGRWRRTNFSLLSACFLTYVSAIFRWSLYPIFVAVFWIEESSCIGSDLVVSTASLSPLIGCMFAARYHLLIVCIGWMGVTSATALMYFLRVLDERRYLKGSSNARWWNLGPFVLVRPFVKNTSIVFLILSAQVTCAMVWIGLAAAILSLVMMGKPFFSSAVNADDKIYLAAPGKALKSEPARSTNSSISWQELFCFVETPYSCFIWRKSW